MATKSSPILQEAVDKYLLAMRANGRAHNTVYNVANTLRLWQGDVGELSLDRAAATIPSYLSRRLDALSHNSGVVEFQRLRCFMRYCVGQHWLPDNPLEGMRPPRTMDTPIAILSDAQIQALLDAGDPYDRAALFLMLGSGMRIGEVAALRWADCTGDRLTVHGKGSKIRRVDPGMIAMRTLEELPRTEVRVFPMSVGVMKWRMWRLSERTGIPFHAHLLRHSFAMRFIRAGGTIDELSRLLGHSKIDTTATYLRADLEERALAAQRRLNPADIFWQGPTQPPAATPAVGGYGNVVPFRQRATATG